MRKPRQQQQDRSYMHHYILIIYMMYYIQESNHYYTFNNNNEVKKNIEPRCNKYFFRVGIEMEIVREIEIERKYLCTSRYAADTRHH